MKHSLWGWTPSDKNLQKKEEKLKQTKQDCKNKQRNKNMQVYPPDTDIT